MEDLLGDDGLASLLADDNKVVGAQGANGGVAHLSAAAPAEPQPFQFNYAITPSLRGKLEAVEGSAHRCRGLWAMTDAQHAVPGQSSEYEFKLLEANPGTVPGSFPVSGKYRGWFMLKKPPPSNSYEKVEEKQINLVFEQDPDGSEYQYNVTGNGSNRFGNYLLEGKLEEDGSILLYRQYIITPKDVAAAAKKKSRAGVRPPPAPLDNAPREGAGRERKMTTVMMESLEEPALPKLQRVTTAPRDERRSFEQSSGMRQMSSHQRAELQVQKCSELLRELMKVPAAFFLPRACRPHQAQHS